MMKILLLEDDKILCDSLQEFLLLEGYEVDVAYRGLEVFDLTYEKRYDLYIFDVNVPDVSGFDVLCELRASGDETPAIYTTALSDIGSISKGFEVGAEDYIKKPFDPEELVIRIKSRYQPKASTIVYKDLTYDPLSRQVSKAGKTIGLGVVQQSLFHTLITQQNKIVSSYTLMEHLENPNANALRVNLAKLKAKLDLEIKNVRGQGYMIEAL
jgi:DNA-binding response OmpR family regulator